MGFFLKLLAPVSLCILASAAKTEDIRVVRGVSSSVVDQVTTITIDVSRDFDYTTGRLHEPERIYFDIPRPSLQATSVRLFRKAPTAPLSDASV